VTFSSPAVMTHYNAVSLGYGEGLCGETRYRGVIRDMPHATISATRPPALQHRFVGLLEDPEPAAWR
jgi:hypothetical protein